MNKCCRRDSLDGYWESFSGDSLQNEEIKSRDIRKWRNKNQKSVTKRRYKNETTNYKHCWGEKIL